jgi:hypothetical protein
VEISSKTGRNVDKAFDTLVREARDFGKDVRARPPPPAPRRPQLLAPFALSLTV